MRYFLNPPSPFPFSPSFFTSFEWRIGVGVQTGRPKNSSHVVSQTGLLGFSGNAFAHLRRRDDEGSRPGGLIKKTWWRATDQRCLSSNRQQGTLREARSSSLRIAANRALSRRLGIFASERFLFLVSSRIEKSLVDDTLSRLCFPFFFFFTFNFRAQAAEENLI